MMRLFWCCSMTWAHHPATRLTTKIGVYKQPNWHLAIALADHLRSQA